MGPLTGYEAVFNRSFGHLPAWVPCSYDVNGTPDPILEGVWQTHSEVVDATNWTRSELYEDPDSLLRRISSPAEPLRQLRSTPPVSDPEQLRELLARELIATGCGEAKMLELLLAATEIATNALQHGAGIEDVHVGQAHGRFVCEITDRGPGFDDPAAGYSHPAPLPGAVSGSRGS